jgi:5'(3')-deoxyribonucleotidase
MKMPIIAIDVDDVLADSTESVRRQVNKKLGLNLQPEHYKVPGDYWGYYETVWATHGLSDQITIETLDTDMTIDQSHILPYVGANKVLRRLAKHFELVVTTSRNADWEAATIAWLDSNFPGVFKRVIFTDSVHNPGQKSKGEICHEIGASWLVDDNVEHAKTALEQGVSVVLFGEYGWHHTGHTLPDHVLRCKSWIELGTYFERQRRH